MVKKHRSRILILIAIMLLLIGCTAGYAAFQNSAGVKNTFNTGGISIDVKNYTMSDDGEEVPLTDMTTVDYNGEASYIPRLTNNAEEAYLRVKLTSKTEVQDINIVNELIGISDKWMLKPDGYLYLTEPLEHEESIDICKGFDVPDSWDYIASNDMKVKVTADAIQSANFEPDFDKDNPWGDVAVSESKTGDDYEVNTVLPGDEGNIKVVYANTVKGISINSDDFFKDINFMPGDEYTDTLLLSNKTDKTARIMFKTEYKESDLLSMMQLDINNGNTFYCGSMASESLKDYRKIAELKPGEEKTVDVTLSLPIEADNSYQVTNDMSTWYFAIEQDTPKTGDYMKLGLFAGLCLICGIGALLLARKKKDEDI